MAQFRVRFLFPIFLIDIQMGIWKKAANIWAELLIAALAMYNYNYNQWNYPPEIFHPETSLNLVTLMPANLKKTRCLELGI